MQKKHYKLLIFDWDGTLMDTTAKIIACYQATAIESQLPAIPADAIKPQIGLNLETAWRNIYTLLDIPITSESIQQSYDLYRKHYLEIDQTPMPLFEGVKEGLSALNQAGYVLSVATGKSRLALDQALEITQLGAQFVYTCCGDEAISKPHPQMIMKSLDYCGAEAKNALMIGDTHHDMKMASNAGVDSLAVTHGVQTEQELKAYDSLGCMNDFNQILRFLLEKP